MESKNLTEKELAKLVGGWQGRSYVFVQAFKHKKSGFAEGFAKEFFSGWGL